MSPSRYDLRGVSASKDEVHEAIAHLDKGLYPNAFCKILPDLVGGDPEYCNVMHADTAGTKTSVSYMYWRETEDMAPWRWVSQDALVMNIDDLICVGAIDNIVISSTIGRNKSIIPGSVLSALIQANEEFCAQMRSHGVGVYLAGGETADVGDVVRTVDVGITAFARLARSEVISCNIMPGQVIVGLSSSGQTAWEHRYNSGIGSNGLTSARHDSLSAYHAQRYPETYDPHMPEELRYIGSKKLTDTYEGHIVGDLLLSPTRTYAPVLRRVIPEFRDRIGAIIHCSGGAQTKVLKFCRGVHVLKDQLFPIPPVFRMIETESGVDRREMYEVFNMGHRMEIYTDPVTADQIIDQSGQMGLEAQLVGRVESTPSQAPRLTLIDEQGCYSYGALS